MKFKDADLIGIPLRIVVGEKGLKEGKVELKLRTESQGRIVPLADVPDVVGGWVNTTLGLAAVGVKFATRSRSPATVKV